jgi:hypothetical protein
LFPLYDLSLLLTVLVNRARVPTSKPMTLNMAEGHLRKDAFLYSPGISCE